MIRPGRNIAVKVPQHQFDATVAWWRDKVGLKVTHKGEDSIAFAFGPMTLWLDRVARQSRTDVWLELIADDPDAALERLGSPLRDELEPLDGIDGHWTSDPSGVVLLVRRARD